MERFKTRLDELQLDRSEIVVDLQAELGDQRPNSLTGKQVFKTTRQRELETKLAEIEKELVVLRDNMKRMELEIRRERINAAPPVPAEAAPRTPLPAESPPPGLSVLPGSVENLRAVLGQLKARQDELQAERTQVLGDLENEVKSQRHNNLSGNVPFKSSKQQQLEARLVAIEKEISFTRDSSKQTEAKLRRAQAQ